MLPALAHSNSIQSEILAQWHPVLSTMKMLVQIVLLFLATASLSSAAELRVYAEKNAVDSRTVVTNEGTRIEGYASDLVRTLLAEAGHTADIRVVPWPRLMISLETEPNVLAFNMTRTPDREERFHWIGEIRPVTFQLWGLGERAHELPTVLEDVRDYRISAFRDDVVEQYLLSKGFTNLVYVSDTSDVWGMLERRRIDFIPYIRSGMEEFMSRLDYAGDALVPVIELEEISTAHYLVMSKSSDPELVGLLQATFQRLVENGAYEQLLGDTAGR